jgi:PAS domain S-box-containing protein
MMEEVAAGVTQRMGVGFVGKIAETGIPLELADAATDPLVVRKAIKDAGIRALYGVPLRNGDEVIAVAHMGSRTAHEFSRHDKRLFATMASRATSAIFQHMLRESAERTAAQLIEREAELRALADNVSHLAWMVDPHGKVLWFNQRWYDYTGLLPDESIANRGVTAIHPEHVPRVTANWERSLATGEPWEDMFPLRGASGRYRWFLSRARPIHDAAGHVVRWFGTNTDVTDQRFLDEATRLLSASLDHRETLEQIARLATPDLSDWCVVDLVEEQAVRRVAVSHADPAKVEMAREWVRKYPPDWNAKVGVANVIRTGKSELATELSDALLVSVARDEEHLRMLRELGIVSYVIAPLVARGRTLGAITLVSSDSGRRYHAPDVRIAEELGRRAGLAVDNSLLYQASQQAVGSRDEVLAIVSHDLRNPLGAIDIAASVLLQESAATPRTRKHLEIVRRSATRMAHMIDDLLDMATIEARGLTLELASQDADHLVASVVETHEVMANEKGLKIIAECDVPEPIACDRDRVEQVFGNLIGNAIKYCRPGDVIFVRGERKDGEARFSVADTGPGIAASEIAHLFKPYWGAKRHAVKTGTGLGLYIAKGIVDAHGGRIWVESTPGEGATFYFTLPFVAAAQARR